MAYASSLDVVGCFGSSVFDTATILSVVAGHDKMDSTSSLQVKKPRLHLKSMFVFCHPFLPVVCLLSGWVIALAGTVGS
jgi:hypothetical protein